MNKATAISQSKLDAYRKGVETGVMKSATPNVVRALLDEIERLQKIVDKVSKCWRLNEARELVQDALVTIGETKVYIRDTYTDDILEGIVYCLNVGLRLEEKTYVLLRFEDEEERCAGDRSVLLDECYKTREAAQAAGGE